MDRKKQRNFFNAERIVYLLSILAGIMLLFLPACSPKINVNEWYMLYGMQSIEETSMPENIPKILQALDSKNGLVKREAAKALQSIGPDALETASFLVNAISRSRDRHFHTAVGEALGSMGKDILPVLISALDHKSIYVRKEAIKAVGYIGPDAAEAVPHLSARLEIQEDRGLYGEIFNTLGKIGEGALPMLISSLDHGDIRLQQHAIRAIGDIGLDAAEAIPYLSDLFKSNKDRRLHGAVIVALGKIGKDALPTIIAALNHRNTKIRILAVRAIGDIGPDAAEAVPYLSDCLKRQEDEDLYNTIIVALAKIGPPAGAVAPVLLKYFTSDEDLRKVSLNALLKIGYRGDDFIQTVSGYLNHPEDELRIMAIETLGTIGPGASKVVPDLITRLASEEDDSVRIRIPQALADIGPDAKESVPALVKTLSDKNRNIQMEALHAIGLIADDSSFVINAVLPFLQDENPNIRKQAMITMKNLNYHGEEFKEILKAIANEDSHPMNQLRASCILELLSERDDGLSASDSGKAIVYFIRPRGYMGADMHTGIWDREQYIGLVPNGSYLTYETDAGEHIFLTHSKTWSVVKAQLAGDKEYFILLKTVAPGRPGAANRRNAWIELIPQDACIAKETIDKLLSELKDTVPTQQNDRYSRRYSGGSKNIIDSINNGSKQFKRMDVDQGRKRNQVASVQH